MIFFTVHLILERPEGTNFYMYLFKNLSKITHKAIKMTAQIDLLNDFKANSIIPEGFKTTLAPSAQLQSSAYKETSANVF